jgi:pimeloyl-ACP methyl ester carboxylesterase
MYYLRRKIFSIAIITSLLVITATSINYFTTTATIHSAYGQAIQSSSDSNNNTNANSLNIQNIPAKKVHVGDIDIAYKTFGKGEPILLFNGASDTMDNAWDPSFLKGLSSNHTVIVFDPRGIGNTTAGSKPYTMQLLASDAAGLMDALKIKQANVLGYSLGSFTAQQFTVSYPEKVNRLILVAATCGGKDNVPKPPEFKKLQSEIVNKALHNIPVTREEMKSLSSASLGSGWIKLHPESVNIPTNITTMAQLKPGLSPAAMNNQNNVGLAWTAPNWNGACDELAKIAKPTLVITGTDDNNYMPHANALVIAEKIPGACLVQIKDAGHAVIDQYPDEIGKIVNTFLSTTDQSS